MIRCRHQVPGLIKGEAAAMEKEVSLVFKPHPDYDLVGEAKTYAEKGSKILLIKKNPERALKYFNEAVKLLPNEVSILVARSRCKFDLGDESGAREDYRRINTLRNSGDYHFQALFPEKELNQLAGYAE